MRIRAIVLVALCGGCATPTVRVNTVRVIRLKQEGENWRYAYFDAATRVLARRGFSIKTSDRPAVMNTSWLGIRDLVPEEPRLPVSFKFQVTTTNQGVRIHGASNLCWRKIDVFTRRNITCSNAITQTGAKYFKPMRARAITSYIDGVNVEIRREAPAIYRDLQRRGAFGTAPREPATAAATTGSACKDAPDCALQCDDKKAGACARLGAMFENGFGVATDKNRALEYYRRACHGGLKAACTKAGTTKP